MGQKVVVNKDGRICFITFNDPKTLNALTADLMAEYAQVLADLERDDQIGVVILTGAGKAFIAGADITHMQHMSPAEAAAYSRDTTDLYRRMEAMDKIFIAAVNGYALGGGCEMALACDLRIASVKAKFGLPEVSLGIFPGGGGTQRLERLVGDARAKALLYTGGIISAEDAEHIGLVNEITEPENLDRTAADWARRILKNSLSAVRLCKEAVNHGRDLDLANAVLLEKELFALCFATPDQREGMTAFVEKRSANFC